MSRTKFMSVAVVLALSGVVAMAMAQEATSVKESRAENGVVATHAHTTRASVRHVSRTRLDLNRASREELMKLHGVGEATADKIIAARPFGSKHELFSKKIVGAKEYQMIARHVMVKEEPLASGKTHK